MDSMEVNKGIAAVLVAGIAFFLTGLIADGLIKQHVPEHAVIKIEGAAAEASAGPAKQEELPPIAPLLVKADAKAGEAFAKKVCVACHTFNEGGKPMVGPNLFSVVGGPHDHEQGFNYSPALQQFKGQPWTYEDLNRWLFKPSAYAPGTRMSFAGIPNAQTRADVIAYLREDSHNPQPLPAANAAPPAAAGATKAQEPAAPAASASPSGAPPAPAPAK